MAEIRAAQLQEDLLALAAVGHDDAARVVADLSPSTVRRIMGATRVDWLPVELNVELAHAGHSVLGDNGLRRWGRASVRRSMESSLLGPILQGAIRVFGLSPAAILRTAPAAYRAAYRGCGTMVVADGAGDGTRRVLLQELPPSLRDRCFLLAMAGALEGVFDVCGVDGGARLLSPIGAGVEFELIWKAPISEALGPETGDPQ